MHLPTPVHSAGILKREAPTVSTASPMCGRTCIVTGASSGIGKATAFGLAALGAQVAMVCLNRTVGEQARHEIITSTGNSDVHLSITDLSSQASISAFAEEFASKYHCLHVLVNNAGVVQSTRRLTPEGIEMTFAVNHLAPFLLTNLLLDMLKRSAPSRVITLASSMQAKELDFTNLQGEHFFRPLHAYALSKLGNLLFTLELSHRLEGSGVTANCVDPGLVRTNIFRNLRGPFRTLIEITSPFYRTPAKGAATVLYLAHAQAAAHLTGRYFKDRREITPSDIARDPVVARKLWTLSEQLTRDVASAHQRETPNESATARLW